MEKKNYPSKIGDWKKLEKNNTTIALNILYTIEKRNTSSLYFKSKLNQWKNNNSINDYKQRKRSVALSYSKKLSTLLTGKTSKHHKDFHCLNCLHSFRTENKLDSHEKISKNKDF